MEEKRLFVGGLTPSIKEKDLESLFEKFGNVKSIDLKSKFDEVQNQSKVFAFIEMQITPNDLATCFRSYANTKWKNCTLNLQVARESILARLKRERETERIRKLSYSDNPTNKVKSTNSTAVVPSQASTFSVLKSIKNNQGKLSSDSLNNSSDDEPSNPLKIPEFRGLKYHKLSNRNQSSSLNEIKESFNLKKSRLHHEEKSDDSSADTDEIIQRGKFHPDSTSKTHNKIEKKSPEEKFEFTSVQQKLLHMGGISESNVSSLQSKKQKIMEKVSRSNSNNHSKSDVPLDKHELSNKKRIESMRLRESETKSQKLVIKTALSQIDNKETVNNKIRFHYSDDDDDDDNAKANGSTSNAEIEDVSSKVPPKKSSDMLFDTDSSDDDDEEKSDMFRVRPQFEGKKGQKLIALQTKYGNDDRFKMDEKFLESDSDTDKEEVAEDINSDNESVNAEKNENLSDEKQRNMDILQSVLGKEIQEPCPEKVTKSLFRDTRDIRYDPLDPDSSRFELKVEETNKKNDDEKFKQKDIVDEIKMPEVSTDKFYEVNENLKDKFKGLGDEPGGFSLLSMFDKTNEDAGSKSKNDTSYSYEIIKEDKKSDEDRIADSKIERNLKENTLKSNPIKKFFFFQKDDERLTRGTAFFVRTEDLDVLRNDWTTKRRGFLDMFNARKKQAKRKARGKPQRQSAKRGRFRK